ncbi:MAG TPA: hypothetical protein VGU46_12255 [Acidobacteriaceae bacterium]|nr:hypothetical protein [Acidobacteriaceae bacterium]
MKRLLTGAFAVLFAAAVPGFAQTVDDLNIQIHGFATQGFLYTTNNNILTTNSSDGSPNWFEGVVNISAQPTPKLRVAVQGRFESFGNATNQISLDYANADYKVNDFLGVRFGKVKSPSGLFNEMQDIDPSYMWSLLPQSVYPIGSRNSVLSHFGGVVYGRVRLGKHLGKLEYRGWAGQRVLNSGDGYFVPQVEKGLILPNGFSVPVSGAALRWKTPLTGLTLGISDYRQQHGNALLQYPAFGLSGHETIEALTSPNFFGKYERGRWMLAAERSRVPATVTIALTGVPNSNIFFDLRSWYAMATYKVTDKFTVGAYNSQAFDRRLPPGPAHYQKDWDVSGRYDFNQFIYVKAEQHFLDGTVLSYDTNLNLGGLKPTSKLTILKVGVSF